ncbi:MAG TPA: hypothetical protein VHA56_08595 [Mucilaginibacter sp.]|nr:hypothetical protein [Mucilaginibacter sp.]
MRYLIIIIHNEILTIKKINFFIILIVICLGCHKKQLDTQQSLQFVHTGITTRIYKTLYITVRKSKIKLTDNELSEYRRFFNNSGDITEKQKELFIGTRYNLIITNIKTLEKLNKFIISHRELYETGNNPRGTSSPGSYSLVINREKTFSVSAQKKDIFFSELLAWLKKSKCDDVVINAISNL